MAAPSVPEKDYVRLLVGMIAAAGGRPLATVKSVSDFERHRTGYDLDAWLVDALAFEADVVTLAVGANVPPPPTDQARPATERPAPPCSRG